MRKVTWWTALVLVASFGLTPAFADDPGASGPDPASRAGWIAPAAAGTKTTIKLQWGPYVVHPGTDMWRVQEDVTVTEGFATGFRPSVRFADGTEPSGSMLHIHHSGWYLGPQQQLWSRWLFGTGEEHTHVDLEAAAKADPRYADGLRYGVALNPGEVVYGISMLHNKSSQPLTVWLELQIDFVHGDREAIKSAAGLDVHPILPGLTQVAGFYVPRVGRPYVYPRDVGKKQIWAATEDGTMIVATGHMHPGAREIVVSNLGSAEKPCPDEGDGLEGTTVARIRGITRNGVFPSEDFQVGVTKPGWRLKVRKGDRISINAVYDATNYGFVDAMDGLGHWVDPLEAPAPDETTCDANLIDDPGADAQAVTETIQNRAWHGDATPTCGRCDDVAAPLPPLGQHTTVVQIGGFLYTPGDLATASTTGAPWVRKGEQITFVNADWGALVRHTATSCASPCNGAYVANYPNWDGLFDSGVLGDAGVPGIPMTQGTVSTRKQPQGTIDTTNLAPGHYPYYCRLHPWMRGSFYVVD